MINRRTFTALLAGTVAAPKRAWSQQVTAKTVFYASTGPELTLFDVDVADAALQKRSTVTLPANVQYAWPHPSKRWLYVVSSSGGPGVAGTTHLDHRFRESCHKRGIHLSFQAPICAGALRTKD